MAVAGVRLHRLSRLVYVTIKAEGGGVVLNSIGNGGENFHFRRIGASAGNAAYPARARGNCARSGRPVCFPGFSSTAVSRPAARAKGLRPVGKGENK